MGRQSGCIRLAVISLSCIFISIGCTRSVDKPAGTKPPSSATSVASAVRAGPPHTTQDDLLDLAMRIATKIPVNPHLRDRSRAQGSVVTACLDLNQPKRAVVYIEKIDDWMRGLEYAELAFYCVRHGDTDNVQHYLNLAGKAADEAEDWRRDKIHVTMARTQAWLGQKKEAQKVEENVDPFDTGGVMRVAAMKKDPKACDEEIAALDQMVAAKNFDGIRSNLESCVLFFDSFYSDTDRREQIENKMRASWKKLPVFVQIDLLLKLADAALKNHDQVKAQVLVKDAQAVGEGAIWRPEYQVPHLARLATYRFRAGDAVEARKQAEAAEAVFDAKQKEIFDIYRAGALRPLAEAYQTMGDREVALRLYKRVVEEGLGNPNSRPRAQDLCATCLSLAQHGVEPDSNLWARMRQITDGLAPPW